MDYEPFPILKHVENIHKKFTSYLDEKGLEYIAHIDEISEILHVLPFVIKHIPPKVYNQLLVPWLEEFCEKNEVVLAHRTMAQGGRSYFLSGTIAKKKED